MKRFYCLFIAYVSLTQSFAHIDSPQQSTLADHQLASNNSQPRKNSFFTTKKAIAISAGLLTIVGGIFLFIKKLKHTPRYQGDPNDLNDKTINLDEDVDLEESID